MPGHTNNAAMNEASQVRIEAACRKAEEVEFAKLKAELAELTRKASEAWFDNGYLHAENKDLKTQLATLRTLIADYQKAGDSAKEMEAQNKALRAEVERLKALNEDLGYTITHGCMKYEEDGTTVIDKCPVMKENERLKAELAVRERQAEILREGKSDWCDINHWNFGSCGHCDKNEAECKAYKVDHALAQARVELEQEAKT